MRPGVFAFSMGCGDQPRGNRPWWAWDGMEEFWGGHRERHRPAGRVFEQGDLKFVILRMLSDKPRHGYEIIKDLEGRFSGRYAPSPGTVYPTLTLLEDLGYARVVPEEGGKKIYEITDEGRAYLQENSHTVDEILDRIARFVGGFSQGPMMDLNSAFRRLATTTFGTAMSHHGDKEQLERIRDILNKAAADIQQKG